MKLSDARKLKIGDRVILTSTYEPPVRGEVIEAGYNACKFNWDDGQQGGSVIHHRDMRDIERSTR